MRVLWFVPCSVAAMRQRLSLSQSDGGWWIESLLEALLQVGGVDLGVVWGGPGILKEERFEENGVNYYTLPFQAPQLRIFGRSRQIPLAGKAWNRTVDALLCRCEGVVTSFKPDLIHVHGTERPYGLLAERTRIPLAVSIQGILEKYLPVYFGGLPVRLGLRMPSLWAGYLQMRRGVGVERRIFRTCRYFLGRTLWDRSHQLSLSSSATYFHAEELVRRELFQHKWSMENATRYCLYVTSSCSLLKGLDTLLQATALLRTGFPRIQLRIGGNYPATGVGRYFRKRVEQLHIGDCVKFLGWIGPESVGRELENAHVFVLPSYIENSPLSLAEAQVVGVPVVASWAGGIPSRAKDEISGLMFPPGDAAFLALQIRRLFEDDILALSLAERAQKEAKVRHHAPSVVADLLRTYHSIIGQHGNCRRIEEVKSLDSKP